ncbi:DUF6510 family protein [Nocardia sp. NPDC056952]|uniref:DUF6510 family protein n=1 Tax=Nocardia sp. NPDC056952 TaxID=3345979 RepID=UPI00364575EA
MTDTIDTAAPHTGDAHLDGNAMAGPLSAVFRVEITTVTCRCGHCGSTEPVARAIVYHRCPGLVARCIACAEILMWLTETPRGIRFGLGDGVTLSISSA